MHPDRSQLPRGRRSPFHLDVLPAVPPYHRRARNGLVARGELVYYGPMPAYYGIGEVKAHQGKLVVVDFRGTGAFGVHEEAMEAQYLLPVPADRLALL